MSFNKWIVNKKTLSDIYKEEGLDGIRKRIEKSDAIFISDDFSETIINNITNLVQNFK